MNASAEDLQEVPDIGPVVAAQISAFFQQPHNRQVIEDLLAQGISWPRRSRRTKPAAQPLSGKVFVVTGTLSSMTREQAKERIRANGGKVSESVSRKTSFLVCGADPGSKLRKAQELGVKVLNESEFRRMT
jgi:DNA ligase (NAD+)